MLSSFLLSLREGLEAARIIGIVFDVINRLKQQHLKSAVWQRVITVVISSILVGLWLYLLGMKFEGWAEEIFEGFALLIAAGVLTYMILWMQKQGKNLKKGIETETTQALRTGF